MNANAFICAIKTVPSRSFYVDSGPLWPKDTQEQILQHSSSFCQAAISQDLLRALRGLWPSVTALWAPSMLYMVQCDFDPS
jgi:hypothetical protein